MPKKTKIQQYLEDSGFFEPGYLHLGYDMKTRKCVQFTYERCLHSRTSTLDRILWSGKAWIPTDPENRQTFIREVSKEVH